MQSVSQHLQSAAEGIGWHDGMVANMAIARRRVCHALAMSASAARSRLMWLSRLMR